MNHNAICTCFHIRRRTRQCIVYTFSGNQAFNTGYYHKIVRHLCIFSCTDLITKSFNSILDLNRICTEQRILL